MAAGMVKHVVVDSGGFIRNAPLREIGEKIITVAEVVSEIRDKTTRQRLQVLPYDIELKQPTPEAVKAVSDFAKKTGDYRTLSAVDLKVLALTLQLEWQHVGRDHIKTKPDSLAQWTTTNRQLEKPTDIAGFYLDSKKSTPATSRNTSVSQTNQTDNLVKDVSERLEGSCTFEDRDESQPELTECCKDDNLAHDAHKSYQEENAKNNLNVNEILETNVQILHNQEGDTIAADMLQEGQSEDSDVDSGDSDDDDEGWITPSNIQQVKKSMGDVNMEKANVTVGCVTTDFSMQNVLIQMGLNVVSVDGMLIKRAKSYVLRCFACLKVTTNMTKQFCPHCGNQTLQRVSMSVNDDGKIQYYISRRKPVSTRGLQYSLPMPRGGKHANNPILCEDQREAQQRTSKASRVKYDVMDPDYITHNSPFAPIDTQSRAAQLGIRSAKTNFKKRANPNEKKKVYGRRK